MAKDRPTEEQVNDAFRVIYRDYYQDVLDTAEELVGQVRDGDIESVDQATETLDQMLDSDRRVFITWQARLGLLASENSDAYFEEFGAADPSSFEDGIPYSMLMYHAMEADVRRRIEAGVQFDDWPDPFDEDTYEEE